MAAVASACARAGYLWHAYNPDEFGEREEVSFHALKIIPTATKLYLYRYKS